MAFQAQAGIAPQQAGGEGDAAAQSQQLQALIAQLQHQQASSQQMQARVPGLPPHCSCKIRTGAAASAAITACTRMPGDCSLPRTA